MYEEPRDIDRDRLVRLLRTEWELRTGSLTYEPVGYGTHHYSCVDADGTPWFVNVDDVTAKTWISVDARVAFDGLERSLRTAVALRSAGLGFIHAPIPARRGSVVVALDDRYAVSVYEFIEGEAVGPFGRFASRRDREWVLTALGRMHAATGSVPSRIPLRDGLAVPLRDRLFDSLADLSDRWTGGPFSERTRGLLEQHAELLHDVFEHYDRLVAKVLAAAGHWVITHGEPHAANVMRDVHGRLFLIDWDTVALAPPERDLWHVMSTADGDWSAYTSSGGAPDINDDAIELHRLWWTLAEIAGYVDGLRSAHDDDANTREAWKGLQSYMIEAAKVVTGKHR